MCTCVLQVELYLLAGLAPAWISGSGPRDGGACSTRPCGVPPLPTHFGWGRDLKAAAEVLSTAVFSRRCLPLLTCRHRDQVVSTSPSPPMPVLSSKDLILLLSGQCPNPGPSYPCPVCRDPYDPRQYSYQCSTCRSWTHGRCSGLSRASDWHVRWQCPVCSPPVTTSPPPSTTTVPTTPPAPPPIVFSAGAILQYNCNGIQNSHQEIAALLHSKNVLIACLQETKLGPNSNLRDFPNYCIIRRDRPSTAGPNGGGLITLVHHSIPYTPLPTDHLFSQDAATEHLAITATINGHSINIYNIYIPPTTSCPPGFSPALEFLRTQDDSLFLGDFNAHHPSWYSNSSSTRAEERGTDIHEAITDGGLALLNGDSPTRVPSNGAPTSPDLSIASPHIAIDSEWGTITTGNSDHLPILIQLGTVFSMSCPELPQRTFTNMRKANWEAFWQETEERFGEVGLPPSCSAGEGIFRRILLDASRKHIPKGHIPNMIPNLSDQTKLLIRERDSLRSQTPTDPNIQNLNSQIQREISETNKQTWINRAESCSHKFNVPQYFSLIRQLNGSHRQQPPNQPITFRNKTLTRNLETACAFNRQFTSIVRHTADPTSRQVKRRLAKLHPLDRAANPFSMQSVVTAIRNSGNSRAAGPDGLTIHQLKHLGPNGIRYLTHLFNLSYNNADIPAIWKTAIIVPILKPGKPADQGSSYRPISLLCPAAKVFERLILPELNSLPVSTSQHGFRPCRSTTTALLPLVQQIARGFNENRPPARTVTMSIDLSRAFDMVNLIKLISALIDSQLRHNTLRWLSAYLSGRMAYCRYNDVTSPQLHTRTGVPQGSCISPVLFNFFVSSYPQGEHLTTSYADDFNDSVTAVDVGAAADALTEQANRVTLWAEERGLSLSAPKSTVTLFTPDKRNQSNLHPNVKLNNVRLPLQRTPKILGVTFDPHLYFHKHVENLCSRASSRINILRALAGTTWGQHPETIVITFKSLIRSLFSYAAPVWFPNITASSLDKLQVVQNNALRIATGCVKRTDMHHLHDETQVLPVSHHLALLCSQFLARALQPQHPSRGVVTSPSGPRTMKQTLYSRFHHRVEPYTVNGTVPPDTYRNTIRSIHTDAVSQALASYKDNKVLSSRPPMVSPEERSLPRPHRVTLSRLRSGCSPALNSYLMAIQSPTTQSELCPSCRSEPHTTNHLFQCSAHPTPLSTVDLWERPVAAVDFLSGLPFIDLPARRPPPEPPPS